MFKSFLLSSTFKKKTTTTKCSYFNDKIHWLWLMIHPLKKIFLVPLNQSHTNHKQVPVNLLSNNRNTKFPKSHDKLKEKVPKKNSFSITTPTIHAGSCWNKNKQFSKKCIEWRNVPEFFSSKIHHQLHHYHHHEFNDQRLIPIGKFINTFFVHVFVVDPW